MNFDAVKDTLIAEAQALGIAEYDVFFMETESVSTETLKDEISSFSSGVCGGVGFRCIVDGHMGCASTELLCKEEMKRIVRAAVENAKTLENEDTPIIFEGSDSYAEIAPVAYVRPSTTEMKELALKIQKNTYATSEFITDGTQSGVFGERVTMRFLNFALALGGCRRCIRAIGCGKGRRVAGRL